MADGMSEFIFAFKIVYGLAVIWWVTIVIVVAFFKWLGSRERYPAKWRILNVLVLILPVLMMIPDGTGRNDCCSESAFFAPDHALSVRVLAIVCTAAFVYSTYRKRLAPPLIEVLVNCSQLDYQCDGVSCPEGHYLCTIAAKGHPG